MKKTIGIVFGGKSGEHEVSIITSFSIFKEIDYTKFDVLPIYVTKQGEWNTSHAPFNRDILMHSTLDSLKTTFQEETPSLFELAKEVDVFFPLIHGTNGEDGTLQGLFEMLNVPYVGSGVLGSAVGMDKGFMKKIFQSSNIPQGKYLMFTKKDVETQESTIVSQVEKELGYPCFIKPSNAGSSLGITKAKNKEELVKGLHFALQYDKKLVIEEMITGRELEIGILGNDDFLTSAVGEVVTTNDFYDYEAKYQNQDATKIQIPAEIPSEVVSRMSSLAKEVCKALDCYGLSRVDFFWHMESDTLYVNEINTIPGFTPYSMYPLLFKEVGIPYGELIEKLIFFAFEQHETKFVAEFENSN